MDYQAIKQAVSMEQAAQFLGLQLRPEGDHLRGKCPACDKDRVLILNPGKRAFYCHHLKKGGDVIYLVAHVRDIKQSAAGQLLHDAFMQVQPEPKRQPKSGTRRRAIPKTKAKTGAEDYSIIDHLQQMG